MSRISKAIRAAAITGATAAAVGVWIYGGQQANAATLDYGQQLFSDNRLYLGNSSGGGGAQLHLHVNSAGTGKCLGIDPPARQGAPAVLGDCNNTSAQAFLQTDNHDGSWTYSATDPASETRYCLGSNGTAAGAAVGFSACTGSSAQRWAIGRYAQLVSLVGPDICLDDSNGGPVNGTRMRLWSCADDTGLPAFAAAPKKADSSPNPAAETYKPAPPKADKKIAAATARKSPSASPKKSPRPSHKATPHASASASASATESQSPGAAAVVTPASSRTAPVHLPLKSAGSQWAGFSQVLLFLLILLVFLVLLWRFGPWRRRLRAPAFAPVLATLVAFVRSSRQRVRTVRSGRRDSRPAGYEASAVQRAEASADATDAASRSAQAIGGGHQGPLTDVEPRRTGNSAALRAHADDREARHDRALPALPVNVVAAPAGGMGSALGRPRGGSGRIEDGRRIEGGVVFEPGGEPLEPAQLAPWWRPSRNLFTVFVRYDTYLSAFYVASQPVTPLQLAERVLACPRPADQPVLLISSGSVGGWMVQQIADRLQTPVIAGGHRDRWWAMPPQRADRRWSPVVQLVGRYPFTDDELAGLRPGGEPSHDQQEVELIAEPDPRGLALVDRSQSEVEGLLTDFSQWCENRWRLGLYGIAVRRPETSRGAPYFFGERSASVWDLARALWPLRAHWQLYEPTLAVFTDPGLTAPDGELEMRLLSVYLQVPVVDARDPATGADVLGVPSLPSSSAVMPVAARSATAAGPASTGLRSGEPSDGSLAVVAGAAEVSSAHAVADKPSKAGEREHPDAPSTAEGERNVVAAAGAPLPTSVAGLPTVVGGGLSGVVSRPDRPDPTSPASPEHSGLSEQIGTTGAVGHHEFAGFPSGPEEAAGTVVPQTASPAGACRPGVLYAPETVSPTHRSTPQERARLREFMRRGYDAHARAVTRALATRPGLRSNSPASGQHDWVICDLVAVRALAADDWQAAGPDRLPTKELADVWTACLASGLQRLPSYRGPVLGRGPLSEEEPCSYTAGQVVVVPQVLRASRPPQAVDDTVSWAIWSVSGRRTDSLDLSGTGDGIIFPGNSAFRVLGVDSGGEGAPDRVLLRELTAAERRGLSDTEADASGSPGELSEDDLGVRTKLLAAWGHD